MRESTRIEVLGKCYMKSKKYQSQYINGLAIEIANHLRNLEDANPDEAQKAKAKLYEMGYYDR